MNFKQALLREEKYLLKVIDNTITPDQYAYRTCIGPTKWFWIDQKPKKSKPKKLVTSPSVWEKWEELKIKVYKEEQGVLAF